MSRRWGVHCDDCDESNIQNFNADVPKQIVNHLQAYLEIHEIIGNVGELKLYGDYNDDDVMFLDFLKEHREHRLSLTDEYGNIGEVLKYQGQMAT